MANEYSKCYSDVFVDDFAYNVYFYCDFLSRELQKIKFQSEFYKSISIQLIKAKRNRHEVSMGMNTSVVVELTIFDRAKYEHMNLISRYDYYINILEFIFKKPVHN